MFHASLLGRLNKMKDEKDAIGSRCCLLSLQGIKHWFENRNSWYGCNFQLWLESTWVSLLFPIKMQSSSIRGISPSSFCLLMKSWKHDKHERPRERWRTYNRFCTVWKHKAGSTVPIQRRKMSHVVLQTWTWACRNSAGLCQAVSHWDNSSAVLLGVFIPMLLSVAVKDHRKGSVPWPCMPEYFSLQCASTGKGDESFISCKFQRL